MSNKVSPNRFVPASDRAKLEQSADTLGGIVEAIATKAKDLKAQHDKDLLDQGVDPLRLPARETEVTRSAHQRLKNGLDASWAEAKAQILGGEPVPSFGATEGMATGSVHSALVGLLNPASATLRGALGEEVATSVATWSAVNRALSWSGMTGLGEVIPVHTLERIRDAVKPEIEALRADLTAVFALKAPVGKVFAGLDEAQRGLKLDQLFDSVANQLEKAPDPAVLTHRFPGAYTKDSDLPNNLRRIADTIRRQEGNMPMNAIWSFDNYNTAFTGTFSDLLKTFKSTAHTLELGFPKSAREEHGQA